MSDELFHRAGMTVTTYAGPARGDGLTRKRVQLYNHHGGEHRIIDLSAEQWEALEQWFAEQRHPSTRPARRQAADAGSG